MDGPNSEKGRDPVGAVCAAIAVAALGLGLVIAFLWIDGWAMRTFARPPLAAALIAVLDLALFAAAISLAPALSEALRRIGRVAIPRRGRSS